MKTQQPEYNNKTFRGAVQRDSNVVGERFWRDFSSFFKDMKLKYNDGQGTRDIVTFLGADFGEAMQIKC